VKFHLATRRSPLALWQANTAKGLLERANSTLDVALCEIESSGDVDRTTDLARFGSIGIFTAEVDRSVLAGRARIGVHSLKDMVTTLEDGIVLGATLARGPVEDVLVGARLADLADGARVATGSMRRAALLKRERPELEVVSIRGNVDTRLRKLAEGQADALLMARAGLVRLGLDEHITEVLPAERFVPAVGQGIVGVTCRADDEETLALLDAIRDADSWPRALAERSFLRTMRGGCNVPIGAHARVEGGALTLHAVVASLDVSETVEDSVTGSLEAAEALGSGLAQTMLDAGAARLLEAIER